MSNFSMNDGCGQLNFFEPTSLLEKLSDKLLGNIIEQLPNITGSVGVLNQADILVTVRYLQNFACTSRKMYEFVCNPCTIKRFFKALAEKYQSVPENLAAGIDGTLAKRFLWNYIKENKLDNIFNKIQKIYSIRSNVIGEAKKQGFILYSEGGRDLPAPIFFKYQTQSDLLLYCDETAEYLATPFGQIDFFRSVLFSKDSRIEVSKTFIKRLNLTVERITSKKCEKIEGSFYEIISSSMDIEQNRLKEANLYNDDYSIYKIKLPKPGKLPAVPAGNSDSNSWQEGLESSVSSRESKEDPSAKNDLESAESVSESTKDPVSTNSVSEVSSPAGTAGKLHEERILQNFPEKTNLKNSKTTDLYETSLRDSVEKNPHAVSLLPKLQVPEVSRKSVKLISVIWRMLEKNYLGRNPLSREKHWFDIVGWPKKKADPFFRNIGELVPWAENLITQLSHQPFFQGKALCASKVLVLKSYWDARGLELLNSSASKFLEEGAGWVIFAFGSENWRMHLNGQDLGAGVQLLCELTNNSCSLSALIEAYDKVVKSISQGWEQTTLREYPDISCTKSEEDYFLFIKKKSVVSQEGALIRIFSDKLGISKFISCNDSWKGSKLGGISKPKYLWIRKDKLKEVSEILLLKPCPSS